MPGKRWRHYTTADGNQVVRAELDALHVTVRAAVVEAMKRRQRGEQFPHEEERVGGRLHAVRVTVEGNEYRVLYASVGAHDQVLLGLHVLAKKSQKLPRQAREKAERRLRDWEQRGG